MRASIKNLLATACRKLGHVESAQFEAELLMAHVLRSTRSFLYANPELELLHKHSGKYKKLVKQRARGQPIAYLTGECEFWSLSLLVNPAVLIPRSETELLVEAALDKIPNTANWRIADLGTGSGAIALALATERKSCEIHATDISEEAIATARENANRHDLRQVHFHHGSWDKPLTGKFHLVVSNPPYVDADDSHLDQGDLRFEPRAALTPGKDGLVAIRTISQFAKTMLLDGGWLMVEHGWEQGPATREVMADTGLKNIATLRDLQGHERVTIAECK